MKTIRKNATVADNYRALAVGRKHGICTRGTMIAGMPEERFADALDSVFFTINSGVGPEDLRMTLKPFLFPGTHWERWFRDRHPDFSWEKMPERFKKGSMLDSHGNISLPCYRWKGLPYYVLLFLYALSRHRLPRACLRSRWVQRIIKALLVRVVSVEHPASVYDR